MECSSLSCLCQSELVLPFVASADSFIRFVPIAVIWAWLAGNVAGANKRAAATGLIFSFGNIGGAISGQLYRVEWAPRYVQAHAINLGCYILALGAGTVLWYSYKCDNMRRDALEEEQRERGGNMLGERLGDLGDRHPHFRYTL
jgi:hypothetical protein